MTQPVVIGLVEARGAVASPGRSLCGDGALIADAFSAVEHCREALRARDAANQRRLQSLGPPAPANHATYIVETPC